MPNSEELIPQPTGDGSYTFISQEFGESFHSHYGAKQESLLKFVVPTQLANLTHKPTLRILDVCYGLGYNTASALQTIWDVNPDCQVEVMALEINPLVPQAAIAQEIFATWDDQYIDILSQLAFEHQVATRRLKAKLMIDDARKSIQIVNRSDFLADAIFLDPFSPPQCPQLWTIEFIQQVALCLHSDGLLATYSCAAAVRVALLAASLAIGSTPPVGRRTPGTLAAHRKAIENATFSYLSFPPLPLSKAEQEHLLTRAAIPYRDPDLSDSAPAILMRRQQEQQTSSLEPTSRWRKRWYENIAL
jgi:tRNA U34 5-methylaminomethyl-2-thiouridine-forming methyltransferase MnmC